jgi:hypothetical protein
MKLWQKNFLVTSLLFIIVLYVCVFFLAGPPVFSLLSNARAAALSEEYAISRAMDGTLGNLDEGSHRSAAASFAGYYEKNGIFLDIRSGDSVLFSNIPYLYPARSGTVSWTRQNGETYIHIADELVSGYSFVYSKSVEAMVKTCIRQCVLSVGAGTGVILALCLILYITLKKINEPIDRLAHELRTPLTAISGYAETLMISRLTEKQRHLAAGYILDESRRLSEISEKLLTMSGLRDRTVKMEPVDIEELFLHIKRTYGRVEYTVEWSKVIGDRALLQSLVGNLVQNALNASSEEGAVELIAKDAQIIVRDRGKGMDETQLEFVNDPSRNESPFERKGLGIPLCHEIARLHKAVLQFTSEKGKGTEAVVTFYD